MSQDYDPRAYGADCDRCPLKGHAVVPPEWHYTDLDRLSQEVMSRYVALVGEAPGEQEEKQGRPFIGPSGAELDRALRMAGIQRKNTLVTNVLLCRPPGNKLDVFLTSVNKRNQEAAKAAKEKGEKPPEPIPSPIECCRPRLEYDLIGHRNIIALGKVAMRAVTGSEASIMAVRGAVMEYPETETTLHRLVMPTIHPAFVLRQQRWAHVFRNDIGKAARWFKGQVDWEPPAITYQPSPDQLREFLLKPEILAFDLETDGIEPLTARIRCVGVGTGTEVYICGFLSKDGVSHFYAPDVEQEVKAVLVEWLADQRRFKTSWNGGSYDRTVLEQQWGVTVRSNIDGILIHRNVESELPHGLAYAASMYTTAPAWKSDRDGNKLSTYAESDQALHQYCALDVGITHRILPPLVDQLKLRGGESILAVDQGMQAVCVDMHTVGMYVDQEKRLEEEKRLLKRRFELLHTLRDRLYDTNTLGKKAAEAFNPGSVQQLSDILFTRWNIIPPLDEKEALTSNGDPSTADVVLRAVLMDQTVPKERRDIIKLLRYYRKVQKILGTYVLKLRLRTMTVEDDLGWDEEEDWVDRETRKRYGMERTGIVDPVTGRMYPGWSASVAVTGRLSSSKPINAQNFPVSCRSMVMAAPGNVLVGADADQLEVRVASALWGIERYLQAFREGKDPHSMTAFMIFGDAFCKAAGIDPACFDRPGILEGKCYKDGQFVGKGEAKDLRSLGKGVHFACVDKDEPVIVLGPEGQKPISELQVGDWTWTWATARKRYEPSRITAVVPKGQKACVRVHFSWWGGPRKGRCTGSMVVTDDHRCLLRDGTYRAAGSLRPGDRLMPFRRRTKTSAEGREYRWVFPYNNQEERAEHRCVAGYYDNDRTNIHHESGITLNNNPANLTAMSPAEHTLEHASNLTASRLGSQKWRDSVRQPKVNLDPEKKAAAVAKRAETMKQNNTYPKSRLDPWADRMGHVSDQVIAAEANVTHQAVYYYRKTRGIPAYWKGEKGGTNHEVTHIESVGMREVWDIEVDHEDHNFPLASGVFVHNSQYMAGDERVQKMIASTEVPAKGPDGKPADDGTTDLPYALLPLSKVRQMREKWLKGVPEYAIGWQREIEEWRDQGFLQEPVTLRRRDFLDGEAPNELVNFKVQGGAAGLMNLAMLELHAQIPRHKWGPGTGIIGQVHDWIGIECPESEAEKVKSILEGVMNRTHPSLPGMKFTATAVAGKRWSEV